MKNITLARFIHEKGIASLIVLLLPFIVFAGPAKTVYSKSVPSVWTNGATWSSTSGGGTCSCVPDESKDVIYIETNTNSTAGLTFGAAVTMVIRNNSTLTIDGNTIFSNGAIITVEAGSSLVINGNLDNQNNSDQITFDGSLTVNGNFTGGNGSTIVGSGTMTTTGSISTSGSATVFGSSNPCPVGPCTASTSGGVGPLPVEFISFDASPAGNTVEVAWSTAAEFNSDYFRVQRSTNGVSFTDIAEVPAAGNSATLKKYVSADQDPVPGISFYRLKQVDVDGKFMYSDIVSVSFQEESIIGVYPNPAHSVFTVAVSGSKGEEVKLVVRDVFGQECYSRLIVLQDYQQAITIDPARKLCPGIYIVAASTHNSITEKKITIIQ